MNPQEYKAIISKLSFTNDKHIVNLLQWFTNYINYRMTNLPEDRSAIFVFSIDPNAAQISKKRYGDSIEKYYHKNQLELLSENTFTFDEWYQNNLGYWIILGPFFSKDEAVDSLKEFSSISLPAEVYDKGHILLSRYIRSYYRYEGVNVFWPDGTSIFKKRQYGAEKHRIENNELAAQLVSFRDWAYSRQKTE